MKLKSIFLGVVVGIAAAAPAWATPVAMQISDGTTTVHLPGSCPAPASCYSSPTEDIFDGSIGAFSINITTGGDGQAMGQLKFPSIDLYSVDNSSGAGTLTILMSEAGFTTFGPATMIVSRIQGDSMGPASITYKTWYDPHNKLFGETTPLVNYASAAPYETDAVSYLNIGGPFSLTEEITIAATDTSFTGFSATMAVPEPGSLMLLGAGLVGLGMIRRRRT